MCREALITALGADDKAECFDNSTTAKEKGKEFRLENKSKKTICRVKVDGCLIDDKRTKRCDYLFRICETEKYFLVELKGNSSLSDAVIQISRTFDFINERLKLSPQYFEGVIVASKVPRANLKFRKVQEKCYRDKKLKIHIESQKCIRHIKF